MPKCFVCGCGKAFDNYRKVTWHIDKYHDKTAPPGTVCPPRNGKIKLRKYETAVGGKVKGYFDADNLNNYNKKFGLKVEMMPQNKVKSEFTIT